MICGAIGLEEPPPAKGWRHCGGESRKGVALARSRAGVRMPVMHDAGTHNKLMHALETGVLARLRCSSEEAQLKRVKYT